ncbi:PREDICTED: methylosome protein 50-like [Nanorana parkeri]|uniref:methylosome protein 50-like n=1 Tax=Nanorana parkeri TaxID=125878 RepID=UPI0008549C67|nr:PREDICTED: methylosome protein 50-like [Nanorana parkeri]
MRARACMEVHLGAVRYRPDGALLMSASSHNSRTWGGSIWVFKDPLEAPNESLCTAGVQTEAGVVDVAWVLEKGILVASDCGAVELWELLDNESLLANKFTKYKHDDIVTSLSVFTGGSQLVSGSKDFSVKVWDLAQKTPIKSYRAHSSFVNCVSACPGKETIFLSCSEDGRVLLWDTRNPKPAKRINFFASHSVPTYVAWHPLEDDTFACGDETGNIYIVNLRNPDSAKAVAIHSRPITGLAYSHHSSPLLASISEDCSAVVLDAESSVIFKDKSHCDFVTGVAWSPVNLDSFTTVGWDHKVLHHSIQKNNNPEPQALAQA